MNFEDPLDFNYSMNSKAAIRFVLDSLHLIKTDEIDLYVMIEALDYLHYEGKTKLSLFEKRLAENLMETLTYTWVRTMSVLTIVRIATGRSTTFSVL